MEYSSKVERPDHSREGHRFDSDILHKNTKRSIF
jgi:hypothetical protein